MEAVFTFFVLMLTTQDIIAHAQGKLLYAKASNKTQFCMHIKCARIVLKTHVVYTIQLKQVHKTQI